MLFARVKGRYTVKAENVSEEDFRKAVIQIAEAIKESKIRGEDVLLVLDLDERKTN